MDTMAAIALAKKGDKQAEAALVEGNLGLVHSVVRKFSSRGCDAEDLFQIGAMGLVKAIHRFDLSYGVRFSTYAVPMIMGEIKRFLRDDGAIKVSRSLKELAGKAYAATQLLERELCRQPTIGELANHLGVEPGDLVMAMDAAAPPESIYQMVNQGDKGDIYLIDKLSAREREAAPEDKIALHTMLSQLPRREKSIIYLRYYKGRTQTEIARRLGISQVQVSRLEKKILSRLRQELQEA